MTNRLPMAIFVVAATLAIFLANFSAATGERYLLRLAEETATPELAQPTLGGDAAAAATAAVVDYVKGKTATLNSEVFRPEEAEHLAEVREKLALMKLLLYAFLAVAAASLLGVYMMEKNWRRFVFAAKNTAFGTGIATLTVAAALFLASISFDSSFEAFHRLLFATQWQFPADYLLVNLFTTEFFAKIARSAVTGAAINGLALVIAATAADRYLKYREAARTK